MTDMQMLRAERRRLAELHRRERRAETIKGVLVIVAMLLALALAGTLDYEDRVRSLESMQPSASWWEAGR